METSLLQTLADKHKPAVAKMAKKHGTTVQTPHGPRTCMQLSRAASKARSPWSPVSAASPYDGNERQFSTTSRIDTPTPHAVELVNRLLAEECEALRVDGQDMEVHHVRKLADLKRKGRQGNPAGCRS